MAKVLVTGWKEIDKALTNLPVNIQKRALRSALRKGAKRIAVEAAANAPRATGELKGSYKVRALPRSRTRVGYKAISRVPYANVQEYGTKFTPGKPHLRPAGYGNRKTIRAELAADIAQAIKK